MDHKYAITDKEGVYFITFATIGWDVHLIAKAVDHNLSDIPPTLAQGTVRKTK